LLSVYNDIPKSSKGFWEGKGKTNYDKFQITYFQIPKKLAPALKKQEITSESGWISLFY